MWGSDAGLVFPDVSKECITSVFKDWGVQADKLSQWHSFTSQKIWIINKTVVETSTVAVLKQAALTLRYLR